MTIESALDAVQNFRSQIDQWGVTAETLIAVAGLAAVMFIFSLREVLTWFLRVHTVRDEVKSLRAEIAELKNLLIAGPPAAPDLVEIPAAAAPASDDPSVTLKKKVEEKPAKAFRLDH